MVAARRLDASPIAVVLVAAVALGLVLGLAAQHAGDVRPGLGWIGALGAPWLITAFAAGALAPSARIAGVAGAIALAVGTAAYYAAMVGTAGRGVMAYAVVVGTSWALVAMVVGAAFGVAGCVWRHDEQLPGAIAAGLLSGAMVGEALLLATTWSSRAALLVVGAQLGAGLTLPALLVRRPGLRLAGAGVALVAAVALGVAEAELRDALRAVGWAGA